MTRIELRRSALFVPASNARALAKAPTLPADVVIFDLEDSVVPAAKAAARAALLATLTSAPQQQEWVLRVNPPGSAALVDDLGLGAQLPITAILLPKVTASAEILDVARSISRQLAVWAMIETPTGVLDAERIASACAAASLGAATPALVIGTQDLALATRARLRPGRANLVPWLAQIVLAARSAGTDVLDGIHPDFTDTEGLAAECLQARDLGMDGKTLIHPSQLATANRAFTPTPDEINDARRVLAAFADPANAGKGALALDGRMIEPLHAALAARTVSLADAAAAKGSTHGD